jgi:hypothetical protein
MDPNAIFGQGNASYGVSQGAQGVPNGAVGALLGGAQSGGIAGQTPQPTAGAANAGGMSSGMLDPGTYAALSAIIPVLLRSGATGTGGSGGDTSGGSGGSGPSAAAGKGGQPSAQGGGATQSSLPALIGALLGHGSLGNTRG